MHRSDRRSRFSVARAFPIGSEPEDDLVDRTTPAERLAMVWPLTREAWSLAGLPVPEYPRAEVPLRVVQRATGRLKVRSDVEALTRSMEDG